MKATLRTYDDTPRSIDSHVGSTQEHATSATSSSAEYEGPFIPSPLTRSSQSTDSWLLPLSKPPQRSDRVHMQHIALQTGEVPIERIDKQPYVHRAWMGVAGSFWQNARWRHTLSQLDPNCYQGILAASRSSDFSVAKLMRHLEGHPVLAVYGLQRSGKHELPIEWDVWLHPNVPFDLSQARIIHGNKQAAALWKTYGCQQTVAACIAASVAGSDVHRGKDPKTWLAMFTQAWQVSAEATQDYQPKSVVLDIKSGWSTSQAINQFAMALKQLGVEVAGVLSFDFQQLKGLHPAISPGYLVHSPAGILTAQALGRIPKGAWVLFNGGSLYQAHRQGFQRCTASFAMLEQAYKQGQLKLAIYVQEDAINPALLQQLTQDVNSRAKLFAGGFAYGGIAGIAEQYITAGNGTLGQEEAIAQEWATWQQQCTKVMA